MTHTRVVQLYELIPTVWSSAKYHKLAVKALDSLGKACLAVEEERQRAHWSMKRARIFGCPSKIQCKNQHFLSNYYGIEHVVCKHE